MLNNQGKAAGQKEAQGDNKFSPPTISLPKGGGAIRGIGEKFAANPVTGTGSMTVPIVTSPGRSGFGPQLSLSYDSGAGNGLFGFGWSLSLPSITRKTDKGLPQYLDGSENQSDSDIFILSGAEDLVSEFKKDEHGNWIVSDSKYTIFDEPYVIDRVTYRVRRYRPRIEGLFAWIERWTNQDNPSDVFWRSISKDNITTWYGKTEQSRITDPADSQRIFSWLICQSYDDKGNAIVYEYQHEDSQRIFENPLGLPVALTHERNRDGQSRSANHYLKRIKYGNRIPNRDATNWQATDPAQLPNDTWMFEVVFDYGEGHYGEDAPDAERRLFTQAQLDSPAELHWPVRQDPFSTYRAGFEVRTYRLCRRVLMFHHFPQELGINDCLVRSTEFSYAESPITSFISSVTQSGYVRQPIQDQPNRYLKKSLPPLEFEYSRVPSPDELARQPIQDIDAESLENLPVGLNGASYQWMDLDGEGTSGILTEQADGWYYKRNLSANKQVRENGHERAVARFGPAELVASKPLIGLAAGAQFLDLAGDGQVDLVQMEGSLHGFYEHTDDARWAPFQPFISWPNLNTRDPDLKFVDLTGDGHADILITEGEALTWYPSLAEDGFGSAVHLRLSLDEEKGPRLVFSNGEQSIYLADLSGDGLSDLVRIRKGEVCYWPNLGYGRFGAKVTMDNSPWFDSQDQFDQRRIRLADTDGSGTTDILYLHHDSVQIYFNQTGNRWSDAVSLPQFPPSDNISSIQMLDLLGNGTACLVWSSPLPGAAQRPMRYLALMEEKPHLLTGVKNNLGAETKVHYAPSTKFYLDDKRDGRPWITKLPFPVHVVDRVETYDHISRNCFVTRYAYHHGYFDGDEREFRGFGTVEQWDTEQLAALTESGTYPQGDNVTNASHVPPIHTKTWFHTGVYADQERVSRLFKHEYFREPGLTIETARPLLLDDTVLPTGLTLEEEREACRALKGLMLRQEVYADDAEHPDATAEQIQRARTPYTVTEQNFTIRPLQPRGGSRYAVFFTHAGEAISYHYERNPADPRIQHALTLEVDAFGNVLKEAAVSYGRHASPLPEQWDHDRQTTALLTYTENRVTNTIDSPDSHRNPLPCEAITFELTGYTLAGATGRYQASDFVEPDSDLSGCVRHRFADEVAYEATATGNQCRRPIEWLRILYRPDDCGVAHNDPMALLPLGDLQPLALAGESYKLAFTPGLLDQVFKRPRQEQPDELLLPAAARAALLGGQAGSQGGYVDLDGSGHWWIPSGRSFYHPDDVPAPAELSEAQAHFFLARRYRDPFGQDAFVDFDASDLLMVETRDALGNRVTVDANDYRVLQPRLVSDPNCNQTEAAFDALGMVAGASVMGKPLPAPVEGDTLRGFIADLTQAQIDSLFKATNPHAVTPALLQNATTRIVYDLDRFRRTRLAYPDDPSKWQPACAATITRETHVSDLSQNQKSKLQVSFGYSDGFGREIQKKIQAESGPLAEGGSVISLRWVGSGWTIFNNKGKPVRQYEPFFSTTHDYEFGAIIGVSPVLFYDPAERVIATLHPNHAYEKVVFDPWQQTTYDVNDTCADRNAQTGNPRTDPDIGGYVAEYFKTHPDDWQTWHAQRIGGALGADEQNAAQRAAAHGDTPTTVHFDALGRPFLTIARNRVICANHPLDGKPDEEFRTRVELDIEGNQRAVRDERKLSVNHLPAGALEQRVVMRYAYDMLGNRIHQLSMEAGARWMLNDVAGKPSRVWDSRGHNFTTTYDALRRPIEQYVWGTFSAPDPLKPNSDPRTLNRNILVDKIEYGEPPPNATDAQKREAQRLNLRTRIYRHSDSTGIATNARLDTSGNPTEAYDFKGNLRHSTRRLVSDYKAIPDWLLTPRLEAEFFEGSTRYDALNRPIQSIAPHSSLGRGKFNVIQLVFNEANLLEQVDVWLEHATEPDALLDPNNEAPSPVGMSNINYDAKGQRQRIDYKNGTSTFYSYDPLTFRLTQLLTRRNAAAFPGDDPRPPIADWPGKQVQNLHYTYDPAGNITHIQDDAQQTIYFRNKRVEPSNDYVYDAFYRLIQADGREHLGQLANGERKPPTAPDGFNTFHTRLDHPGNGQAMGTYTERYVYDTVGNFLQMQHHGTDPAHPGWTRRYMYNETSLIERSKQNNRLSSTQIGNGITSDPETYLHDVHGNMVQMPHLGNGLPGPNMHWDYKDQLRQTNLGGGAAYYVYDASGQRVRKVWEKAPGRIEERIYLGGFEIFRKHNSPIGANTATLERETLHVMDDKQRISLVEMRTLDTAGNDQAPRQLIRYQFGNHLGSASLELDEQAEIISYEEYAPYGSSTYQAVRSQTETPKRYRYTWKERDEESGFYYHGARYYAPWLGRWIICDPAGLYDGVNVYSYARLSPIRHHDSTGLAADDDWSILNDIWDTSKVEVVDPRAPLSPASTPWTKESARTYANTQARDLRVANGMNEGATVQAGHTAAARHAPESGISPQDWDTAPMQELHSRKGQGLDLEVKDPVTGETTVRTRHTAQEGMIDDAVERVKVANEGKLTPQGQLDAAEEVRWRTENVPMDQRDVRALREAGSEGSKSAKVAAIETTKEAAALVKTGGKEALQTTEKTGLKEGAKVLGTKAAKFVPFVGIGVGVGLVAKDIKEGDYTSAAWDAAEAIPVVGDFVGAAHLGITVGTVANEGLGIDKVAAEHGTVLEGAAKSLGFSTDTSRLIGATGAALSSIMVAPSIAFKRTVVGWFR